MLKVETRAELVVEMKRQHEAGYKYVARDKDSKHLHFYSLKPRKYDYGGWGYVNENAIGAKPARVIVCECAPEIKWTNKVPVSIVEWLKVYDR